ncbi:MAG TPA: lysozyme inhibitor LprI family protein [Candidatus Kapabacteria bacterium]|nr:lysozyme inhibitor LprI family protein [Candidatus Kapabacteria bacterium]
MKLVILTIAAISLSSFTSLKAQTKSVELHPFIRWEMKQIARIDILQFYDEKYGDPRDSSDSPYSKQEEERLLDSISNIKINRREDVMLKLTAIDTLINSDLVSHALEEWEHQVMDGLLNTVYKLAMSQSTDDEKTALKANERQWLKKREANYDKEYGHAHRLFDPRFDSERGQTEIASLADADYVHKRIIFLIGKIKSWKNQSNH